MITVTHSFNPIDKTLSFVAAVSPDFAAQDELYKELLSTKYRAEVGIFQDGSSGRVVVTVIPCVEEVDPDFGIEVKPGLPAKPDKPELKPPEIKPPNILAKPK